MREIKKIKEIKEIKLDDLNSVVGGADNVTYGKDGYYYQNGTLMKGQNPY